MVKGRWSSECLALAHSDDSALTVVHHTSSTNAGLKRPGSRLFGCDLLVNVPVYSDTQLPVLFIPRMMDPLKDHGFDYLGLCPSRCLGHLIYAILDIPLLVCSQTKKLV